MSRTGFLLLPRVQATSSTVFEQYESENIQSTKKLLSVLIPLLFPQELASDSFPTGFQFRCLTLSPSVLTRMSSSKK